MFKVGDKVRIVLDKDEPERNTYVGLTGVVIDVDSNDTSHPMSRFKYRVRLGEFRRTYFKETELVHVKLTVFEELRNEKIQSR
jgi:ribosomal protein L21E